MEVIQGQEECELEVALGQEECELEVTLGQEDCDFEVTLGYTETLSQNQNTKNVRFPFYLALLKAYMFLVKLFNFFVPHYNRDKYK